MEASPAAATSSQGEGNPLADTGDDARQFQAVGPGEPEIHITATNPRDADEDRDDGSESPSDPAAIADAEAARAAAAIAADGVAAERAANDEHEVADDRRHGECASEFTM